MIFEELQPCAELQDFVQVITVFESEHADESFPRHQILPDGIVEAVIHYRAPFITHLVGGSHYLQPDAFLISQMRNSIEIESTGPVGFVSARFYPWGAHHFMNYSLQSFLDDYITFDAAWPDSTHELSVNLCAENQWPRRVEHFQSFLRHRLEEFDTPSQRIDQAIKRCRQTKGQITVEELGEQSGMSKKQLERAFVVAVGTTPKLFLRVTRFLDICRHMTDYQNKTLTELAHGCGYYDQSHFIKDFTAFSGFTPKEFFERNNISFADI